MSEDKDAARRAAWLQTLSDIQNLEIARHMKSSEKARHDADRYAEEIAELRSTLQELVDEIELLRNRHPFGSVEDIGCWNCINAAKERHGITPNKLEQR